MNSYVPLWPTPSGPKYPIPKDNDSKGGGGTGPYGNGGIEKDYGI